MDARLEFAEWTDRVGFMTRKGDGLERDEQMDRFFVAWRGGGRRGVAGSR